MSKTTMRKGKQDDKFSLAIREIQSSLAENKKCFDCEQRGPTYVNTTVGSFVCTKCSGLLRGINPPHRIKSISMSTFTAEEVELMRGRGNLWCARVWLATYDNTANPVDYKDDEKIKDFILAKYEKKRYYAEPSERTRLPQSSPSVSSLSSTSSQDNKPLSSLIGTTLKAHIAQSQGQSAISLSRPTPASFPRPQEARIPPQEARVPPQKPQQPPQRPQLPIQPPAAQQQPPPQLQNDSFADFANFESVAFDSLPADPLTAPFPTTTLPPIRKVSQGSNNNADFSTPPAQEKKTSSQQDRYSALKELDELFKTANIQSPGPVDPEPTFFSSAPAPIPKSNGIFPSESGGSPAGGFGRSSPAGWTNNAPVWTPSWNAGGGGGGGGWPAEQSWGGAGGSGGGTNPFGSSPSGQVNMKLPMSENNNDLFAAAPRPFFSEKPGFDISGGNPWSSVPTFTTNMVPAPNPNNPFL